MVTLLKKNGRMIYEDSIKNWMQSYWVLSYIWLDLMSEIVVDGVAHVIRSEEIFEAVLVNDFVLENFNKDVNTSLLLVCIESDLENTIHFNLVVNLILLVSHNEVEDLLNHAEAWIENDVTELWTAKNTFFHVLERNVLEAEYLLGVVVCNGGALHPTDFHLHDVLQKTAPD